ncbi:hypothetical protein Pfo_002457 [Paulownia fortunei]|nr:hypothetical protein Pfo_002457 [Paulownia fortunei]
MFRKARINIPISLSFDLFSLLPNTALQDLSKFQINFFPAQTTAHFSLLRSSAFQPGGRKFTLSTARPVIHIEK